jgi:uncharacterized protein (TIGR03435 family)
MWTQYPAVSRRLGVLLAFWMGLSNVHAQDIQSQVSFAVASIKQSAVRPNVPPGPVAPNRFVRHYVPLVSLITYAYDVAELQVQGGPDWVRRTRFDVDARAELPATTEAMRLMLRQLLTDRFHLTVRHEVQSQPRFALVPLRNDARLGPGIRLSTTDCVRDLVPPPDRTSAPATTAPPCRVYTRASAQSLTIGFERVPISQLIQSLQIQTGRIVIDQTGLVDRYDIELEVARTPAPPPSAGAPEGVSLFTALQEQLGLRLVSSPGPVDVLLIDSVAPLTPN